jgi:hypothetical protein
MEVTEIRHFNESAMKLVPLAAILLLSAGILTQRANAGPFETLRNFFGGRQQPQTHVTHHRPAHPKETKDAPNESPAPMVSPGDQQANGSPGPNALSNTMNRPGRPSIAAAPLY